MQQHNNGFEKITKHSKDNPRPTQKKKILEYFQTHPATVRMCEHSTGISAQTICGYKSQLIDDEKLIELDKLPCQVTGRRAFYYSADPKSLIS